MKFSGKKTAKWLLLAAAGTAVAVYAGAAAVAGLVMDGMMFHPPKGGYDAGLPGYVDIGSNGWTVAALALGPKRGDKAVIYCHGNAEDLTTSLSYLKMIACEGITVAVVDYEGYGLSSGRPTEAGCYRNVHRLYDWLIGTRGFAPSNVVVLGFSIGTGPAVELAASRPVGGLILEAPFLSAPRVKTGIRLLPQDPFPNIARIGKVSAPKLIIHGTADSMAPFKQGRALFAAARGPKRFVPVAGAGHLDFIGRLGLDAYRELVLGFVRTGH